MGKKIKETALFLAFSILSASAFSADIVLNFCPVTKIQASKDWSATLQIQNNSGVVLDFANNKITADWPSLVALQWPFSNGVQTGTNWSFNINLDWPGTLAVGATATKSVSGNKFSGVLQFPTTGSYTQGGKTYTVEFKSCNQTQNFELYDATFDFKRECFLYSPTKLCLGQGATEIWKGEGVFDAMIPTDRPSWAIAVMVAHRLFTNLAGADMVSPNFWMATAMNESRMTCDPTINANKTGGHTYINANANSGVPGAGIYSPTDNCFQILNIGYTQIENNQPDLFAQTNAYGTAGFSNVIAGGNWEAASIGVAYYHYQDMRYWDQIYCFNVPKTWKDAKDPYAIEKIFYHAYHDGPNAGISLLNDIKANYTAATNATNMNTVITTNGTWKEINSGGSSQKVGNFTSMLDGGNPHLYPYSKTDPTTQYLGCYNASIKWTDILYYLNKIKILYPKLQNAPVQAAIKAVFDGINGGANVNFEDLGPVIDEIVIQMGGHDPSKYIATQFSAAKTCPTNALGVSLRTNDTICPGTTGELQVWLSGDKNFKFTLKYPDGSTKTFSNVDYSPYIVPITQPGAYEVVYFEDNDEIGNPNCLFSKLTVQSKNGNVVTWDKSTVTGSGSSKCTSGPLVIKNTGAGAVTISYKKDGVAQTPINLPANSTSYTVSNTPAAGQYIITTISPNTCGTPVNDTINICSSCVKPKATLAGTATICAGDSTQLSVAVSGGTGPYRLKFSNGATKWTVQNVAGPTYTFYAKNAGTYKVDSVWNTACDSLGSGSAVITVQTLPTASIAGGGAICPGDSAKLTITLTGTAPWKLKIKDGATTAVKSGIATSPYYYYAKSAGTYTVDTVFDASCKKAGTGSSVVTVNTLPTATLAGGGAICPGDSTKLTITLTGTAPWKLKINDGSSITVKSGIATSPYYYYAKAAGTYTVDTVFDASCKNVGSGSSIVTVGALPTASISGSSSICVGDSTQLSVALTGTAPYTLKINDGSTVKTVSGIATSPYQFYVKTAATYTIDSVLDASCKNAGTGSAVITNKPTPTLVISGDTTICTGETAQITLNLTGTAPFNITATVLGTPVNFSTNLTTYIVPLTLPGLYTIDVTDGGGCKVSKKVTIVVNTPPALELGADQTLCFGKTATLDAGANMTYAWTGVKTGAAQTMVADVTGDYKVVITDANACKTADSVKVTIGTKVDVAFASDSITICPGGSINLSAVTSGGSPAYTYQWSGLASGTAATFSASAAGWHKLTVSDNNLCTGKDSIYITVDNNLTVNLSNKTICPGDSVTLDCGYDATNYTIAWSTLETTQTINVNSAGTYTVHVENGGGCSGDGTMDLTLFTQPVVSLGVDKDVCAGTTTLLDAGAVFSSYKWNTLENTKTVTKGAGTYNIEVVDGNGCKAYDTITVNSIAKPTPNVITDVTTCLNTNVTFDVSSYDNGNGPFTYKWNDNSTASTLVLNGVTANSTHWVDVTDKYGCTGRDSANVIIQAGLSVVLAGAPDTTVCAGQAVTLNSNFTSAGGYNFNWSTGETTESIVVNNTANITLTVDDGNGCNGTDLIQVKVNPLPNIALVPTTASVCSGDAATIGYDYGAGYSYAWTPSGTTPKITVNTANTYSVTVTNTVTGCKADTDVVVTINAKPLVSLREDLDTCAGITVTLQNNKPEVGVNYNWTKASTGNTSIAVTPTLQITANDTYTLTVTNPLTTCVNSDLMNALFRAMPSVDLLGGTDTSLICEGEVQTLDAGNAGMSYLWEPNKETVQSITVSTSGWYAVEVSNGMCKDTDAVYVRVISIPQGILSDTLNANSPNYCFAEELDGVDISAESLDGVMYNYIWAPNGETTQSINVKQSGTYVVTVSLDKCSSTEKISLIDYCPTSIFVPQAFTPNGDAKNEVFKVVGANAKDFELFIFNRWGEQIFRSTDINEGWDGTSHGSKVQIDVYVWKLTYSENLDTGKTKKHVRMGTVALVE
ncbi:MAG: gliding motility-associated C-terminal domain-containing protein [Flavobacteriales bacterium]